MNRNAEPGGAGRDARRLRSAGAGDAPRPRRWLTRRIAALPDKAGFAVPRALAEESRAALFAPADARSVELIFGINIFATRSFGPRAQSEDAAHRCFVHAWREAKLMERSAIAARDVGLAGVAARHLRGIWNARIGARVPPACDPADPLRHTATLFTATSP